MAVPEKPDSLARGLGQADGQYSQWFNSRYRRGGHLWQERFSACALDRAHLLTALAYVDLNPVRAGLVRGAAECEWSSAAAHISNADSDPLLNSWAWSELPMTNNWADILRVGIPHETTARLRQATHCGHPFGDESFIQEMERRAGRDLHRKKPGPAPSAKRAAAGSFGAP